MSKEKKIKTIGLLVIELADCPDDSIEGKKLEYVAPGVFKSEHIRGRI